jgi:CheY-like chemotaxis protein
MNDSRLALVADDSRVQRVLLQDFLEAENFSVIVAENGKQAITLFNQHLPELVLMDVNMPEIDGWQAVREIRKHPDGEGVPIIFVTSLPYEDAVLPCAEAGGNEILSYPFSQEVFKAKIINVSRATDLYSQLKTLQKLQRNEAQISEQLFSTAIESDNVALDKIQLIKKPAELFSGDIELTAACPNGDINILLGDFTGHGLQSTIGALPVAETFRAMTEKGYSLSDIVIQINAKLYRLLPKNIFLSMAIVSISATEGLAHVINAGLPDVLIFDGYQFQLKCRVESCHPPLGILPKGDLDIQVEVIEFLPEDRLLMVTDGISEAIDTQSQMFGEKRLLEAALTGLKKSNISLQLISALEEFCTLEKQVDDMSIIEVPGDCCAVSSLQESNHQQICTASISPEGEKLKLWHWQFNFTAQLLRSFNPIPMIMGVISEIEGSGEHIQSLYTLLVELYNNALEHGVLGLDSQLKSSQQGFVAYYKTRELLLEQLVDGEIYISVDCYLQADKHKLFVNIEDSGEGFNWQDWMLNGTDDNDTNLCGRGIELVRHLADSLEYNNQGNKVTVVFSW